MTDALLVLAELAAHLDRLGIRYVVGGSLASGAWGEPRSTHDVDVLIRLDAAQVGPLAHAVAPAFYVDESAIAEALRTAGSFNVIHLARYQKIDVFVAGDGALDGIQLERPALRPLAPDVATRFPVTAPEIVVLRKLAWYRLGDETSARQWRDLQAVLRVQRGRLDLDLMRDVARREGLSELLIRALREAYPDDRSLPSERVDPGSDG